jgi:hypothetical protein
VIRADRRILQMVGPMPVRTLLNLHKPVASPEFNLVPDISDFATGFQCHSL